MKNLKYDMIGASKGGYHGHPQDDMKKLGIKYQYATPQLICDQWWFWCCENIPEKLPEYIAELKADPIDFLSKLEAEKIIDYGKYEKNIRLSSEDLELCRQWFCNVQDLNPEVLNKKDYQLAKNIHDYFGIKVSNSLQNGLVEKEQNDD